MELKWKLAQAAEIRWWDKYLKTRDKEEYYQWKKSYWNDFISNLKLDLTVPGQTILDAGCGPAGIFTALQNQRVYAVDPLLDKYSAKLKQFDPSEYPNVTFVNSTLERFKTAENFDVAFCLNCINHVKSIPSSLANIFNLLKPGGELVLSTDAHNYGLLKFFFQIVPGDLLHPHQYGIEEYNRFVRNAGFQIRKTQMIKSDKIFSYWVIQAYKPR